MVANSGFGKKGRSFESYELRGSHAQKVAIESLRNIANVDVAETESKSPRSEDDLALAHVVRVLRNAGKPLAIAEVAEELGWDSDKAANVLSRGGNRGELRFLTDGMITKVTLA